MAEQARDPIRDNAAMRGAMLALSPRFRKNLGNFTGGTVGGTTRIKLYNVGVVTRLRTRIVSAFDLGAGAATVSPQAPFNVVSRYRLTDFDGTDRVNITGFLLWLVNCKRHRTLWGYHNAAGGAAVSPEPVVPVTAATANQTFASWNEIPLAYKPEEDLRGAILAQTALGEMYLNIDWVPALFSAVNAEAVYIGGTASAVVNAANSLQAQVWQDFLLPQALGGQVPIPRIDLSTVYELTSLRSTDNIAAGQEKLINYPNVRSVLGLFMYYINNGVMNGWTTGTGGSITNDMSQFRIIANGNNVLYDNSAIGQYMEQRLGMSQDNDLRASTYFWDHSMKPIETAVYGNVQLGATPAAYTASGNTAMVMAFESMFAKGAVLPGLSQASG